MRRGSSDHQLQNPRLLRLCALCGKTGDDPIATVKSKITCCSENNHFKDTSTECTELEWKIFLGITTLGLLENIQNLYLQCEPEHFNERIIFMSVYNDNVWQAKRNKEQCEHKSLTNFSGSGHPIFRVTSAFERGELGCKRGGKKSLHFNGGHERISANKLSIYGAIADVCDEVPKSIRAPGKLAAPQHMEKMEIPADFSIAENSTKAQQWRNLAQEYERKFDHLSEDQKLSKLCSDAGLKLSDEEIYVHTLETQ